MGKAERRKGVRAEAEVRTAFGRAGFTCRGLESGGDWLAFGRGHVLAVEVKRQEVPRLPLWTRQAVADAPPETTPIVCFRRSHEPWSVVVPKPPERLRAMAVEELTLNGRPWLRLTLDLLLSTLGSPWMPPLPTVPLPAAPAAGSAS